MHEASLIETVLQQSLAIASANGPGEIVEIHLSFGPLSNVEQTLLTVAFRRLAPAYGLGDAALILRERELTAACRGCQLEYGVRDFEFQCPTCGSTDADVLAGDAVMIESLTLGFRSGAATASTYS